MGKKGSLEVICGSMFSGKTEELMRRLKRAEYARQRVLTIKHQIDTRRSVACIASHSGLQRDAVPLEGSEASWEQLLELAGREVQVVGIDEVQFFPHEIQDIIWELVDRGKRVLASGLDLDFRGEPFGMIPTLMAQADRVTKLRAICVVCSGEANFSQRLINGRPARYDDPTILVGAEECYEARCRNCYIQPTRELTPAGQASGTYSQ